MTEKNVLPSGPGLDVPFGEMKAIHSMKLMAFLSLFMFDIFGAIVIEKYDMTANHFSILVDPKALRGATECRNTEGNPYGNGIYQREPQLATRRHSSLFSQIRTRFLRQLPHSLFE